MEQYKLSQNPSGSGSKPGAKKKKPKKSQPPKRASTQSLDPAMIAVAIVAIIVIIGGSVLALHFIKTKSTTKGQSGSSNSTSKNGSKGQIPAKAFNDVTKAIEDKNFNNLKGYYASRVKVVIPRKSVNQTVSGSQVGNYINDPLNAAVNPWVWHVSPEDLSAWQQGPYGDYFTGNVLVGISSDGTVISVGFNDQGQIVTIFVAPQGDLTNPGTTPPSGSNGGDTTTPDSGGSQTSPPVPTSENAND